MMLPPASDSPPPRRVLIAGVSSHWGTELARRLEREPGIEHIAGIDSTPPGADLGRTAFIEADLRSSALARLLAVSEADTVVHCGIASHPEPGRSSDTLHETNVIGTLRLLAACAATPTLERLVVRSSAAIYGCEGSAPAFFTEELARTLPLRTRFERDVSELEEYVESFARRHPHVVCCVLRFQPEIGPDLATPLTRYLRLPVIPTQLGFDPPLQLLHAEDATGALATAVRHPVRGPVNVAPGGTISLSRALRLGGRPMLPIPHPLFRPALSRLGAGGLDDDTVRVLRFGRGIDNRRLREDLGYEPRFDATGAVRDLHSGRGRQAPWSRLPDPGAVLGSLVGPR